MHYTVDVVVVQYSCDNRTQMIVLLDGVLGVHYHIAGGGLGYTVGVLILCKPGSALSLLTCSLPCRRHNAMHNVMTRCEHPDSLN